MRFSSLAVAALSLSVLAGAAAAAPLPLTAQKPIPVPGGPGAFDWMIVDAGTHRLYASHKGTGNTAVLDLTSDTVLPPAPTGKAQGLAVDAADNKLFAGDDDEQQVVVLDRSSLKVLDTIKVTGPVDAVAFDPKNGMVYADHDDGTEVWVIDAKTDKVVGSVTISGAPEFVEYAPSTDRLYQNVKTTNQIAVIDPATNKVEAAWPTAPVTSPHGLALDEKRGRVYSAGPGRVAVFDIKTGKLLGTTATTPGSVDQIAFDARRNRLYCACANVVSVLAPTKTGLKLLGNVPAPKRAHTLTVNPADGSVWVSYTDASGSYLQKFTAS